MFNKYILFLWPWSGSFGWVVIGLTALPVVLRCSTACEAVKPCFPFSQVKPLMLPLGRSDEFELVFSTQIWFDPAHLRSFPKLSRNICAPCVSSCHLKIHTYIHICLFKVCLFIFSHIYLHIFGYCVVTGQLHARHVFVVVWQMFEPYRWIQCQLEDGT